MIGARNKAIRPKRSDSSPESYTKLHKSGAERANTSPDGHTRTTENGAPRVISPGQFTCIAQRQPLLLHCFPSEFSVRFGLLPASRCHVAGASESVPGSCASRFATGLPFLVGAPASTFTCLEACVFAESPVRSFTKVLQIAVVAAIDRIVHYTFKRPVLDGMHAPQGTGTFLGRKARQADLCPFSLHPLLGHALSI